MDNQHLTELIVSRLDWIRHHRAKVVGPSDGSVLVWGRRVKQDVRVTPGQAGAELVGNTLVVRVPDPAVAEKAVARWRRNDLLLALNPLLEKWQRQLDVRVGTVTLRTMTTRWGSCNPSTRRVTFNTLLAQKRPVLLEYVVVHELTHLIVPNHGPDFRTIMSTHLPKWPELRNALNSSDSGSVS